MVESPFGWQLSESSKVSLFFGMLAIALIIVAYLRGFFRLPQEGKSPISFYHVLIALFIYLGMYILIAPLIENLFGKTPDSIEGKVLRVGLMNVLNSAATLLMYLFLFYKVMSSAGKYIWKTGSDTYKFDILMGLITWIIAFPVVIFSNEILEFLVRVIFGSYELTEQIAIQYVKLSLSQPSLLFMAILSILVFAPLIEEFLFRGVLQSWLKRLLGVKAAILLSSLCFALFHFSIGQGVANISIIGSLFILALFLGFLYERQRSLLAPITLHAVFNTFSIFNLLLSDGG